MEEQRRTARSALHGSLGAALALALVLATGQGLPAQEPVTELDTLQVQVSSRALRGAATTRSVTVVTADRLRRLPVRSVAEALRWVLGADLLERSPAQADLAVRGGTFEQVLVLVDGIPVSDPQTGHFNLNLTVPLERVERIEVLRGAGSSLHGSSAVGGVVNVVTREGSGPVSVTLEGASFDSRRLTVGGGWSGGALRLSGSAERTRSDGHRPGTDYDISLLRLRGTWELPGGRVTAALGRASRRFGADGFYAPFPSYEETRTADGYLRWEGPVGRSLDLELTLHRRVHDDDFILKRSDPSFYRNVHTSRQDGVEVLLRAPVGPALALAAGASFRRDALESTNLGRRRESRAAVFGEVAGWSGVLAWSAGLRGDWYESFGVALSPALSGSLQVGRGRLRASAGRSFRAPTWTERYYQDPANRGSPLLDPEIAWSTEVGADLRLPGELQVSLTAFRRNARELIDWVRPRVAGGVWEARNIGRATLRGVEGSATGQGPGGLEWRATASVIRVDAAEVATLESKYALRPLRRQVTLGGSMPFGPFRSSVHLLVARREGEEGMHRVDARLSLPVPGGDVYLDLRNLTDTRYRDLTGAWAPGRALALGVRVTW